MSPGHQFHDDSIEIESIPRAPLATSVGLSAFCIAVPLKEGCITNANTNARDFITLAGPSTPTWDGYPSGLWHARLSIEAGQAKRLSARAEGPRHRIRDVRGLDGVQR